MVNCRECGELAERIFSNEQIKNVSKGNKFVEAEQKKYYKCIVCGYAWKLSFKEMVDAFVKKQKESGKTIKEVSEEISEEISEKATNDVLDALLGIDEDDEEDKK